MDTKARSWTKSIIWRVIGIIILPIVIILVYKYIGSEEATVAIWVTVIFHSVHLILYYFHERIWEKIEWGQHAKKDKWA